MAGVADRAMRRLCREFGAAYTVSELVSSKGITLGDRKSAELIRVCDEERPLGIQIFGGDPDVMAAAARAAERNSPAFIDTHMGCPAPKVASNGGGSALLADPALAGRIVGAVVRSVDLPVTVKMRIGIDNEHINAVEVARAVEAAGAAAVTVHGRTRAQMYAPPVEYDVIRAVKQAVKIPVMGNGDIDSPAAALRMYNVTGCDFIMIGRAATGAPWIFRTINAALEGRPVPPEPSIHERLSILKKQAEYMFQYKDERTACLELRKHAAWYMRGLNGAAELRRLCCVIKCRDDLERVCLTAAERNE